MEETMDEISWAHECNTHIMHSVTLFTVYRQNYKQKRKSNNINKALDENSNWKISTGEIVALTRNGGNRETLLDGDRKINARNT